MAKFRKKPVEIEAMPFERGRWKDLLEFTNNTAKDLTIERRINGKATCVIPTLEGQHIANEGDWIIKGIKGEFYPCKPDIFVMTYDKID